MPNPSSSRQAHLDAIRAAREAGRTLGLHDAPWVDPFDAIAQAGALLLFKPLSALCGAYLPATVSGGAAGVVINVKHPLALQRYTAAHELGHLWMHHQLSIDTELAMLARGKLGSRSARSLVEVAADVFAANLLMPLAQVTQRMRILGLGSGDLRDPEAVYTLSQWFGVSYQAMAVHLVSLHLLTQGDAERVQNVQPKAVKRAMLRGDQLADWRTGLWPLSANQSGEVVHARVGDELMIRLPSHATGGYLWEDASPDRTALELMRIETASLEQLLSEEPGASADLFRSIQPDDHGLVVGAPREQLAHVRINSPGSHTLTLLERRPWESPAQAIGHFRLTIQATAQPEPGVAPQQRHLFGAAA
jgi:hypothetical protein